MIAGVGRLIKLRGGEDAEFAVLVSDQFQHQGLGRELLSRLVQYGRDEGMRRVVADILPENSGMIRVAGQLGFKVTRAPDDDTLRAELVL
jgi:acetyltransferase